MKKGLIVLIIVSFFLVGCGSGAKEVVIDSGLKEESREKIEVTGIKEEGLFMFSHYENGEPMAIKVSNDSKKGKLENLFMTGEDVYYEEEFYKLNKENKFEKVKGDKIKKHSIYSNENKEIGFKYVGNREIEGLTYYNEEENTEKSIKTFKEPISLRNSDDGMVTHYLIEGSEKYAFYSISESREGYIDNDVSGINKIEDAGVIDIETGKELKLDNSFKANNIFITYSDGFYALDEGLNLIELEEKDGVLKRGEKKDLAKEFKIRNRDMMLYGITLKNDEITMMGTDLNGNEGYVILKYNIKTEEKKIIDTECLTDYHMPIINLESGILLLEKFQSEEENKEYFIGRVSDKVEILGRFTVKKEENSVVEIQDFIVNDSGEEFIMVYSNLSERFEGLKFGYAKGSISK